MAKIYKQRKIRNLNDLQKEQDRIREMYKNMEHHMFDDVFSPKTVFTLAFSAFTRRKKRKNKPKRAAKLTQLFTKKNKIPVKSSPISFLKKVSAGIFLKHALKSWLGWQAFGIALFLARQIISAVRHKKSKHNS